MGSLAGHEMAPPNMLGVDVGGTGWLVQLFWQFYLYTGDKKFLRDVAYPLLRDAALLYSDVMTKDSKSGKWTVAPVVHFEARVFSADDRPKVPPPFDMWSVNSSYAQAMFRLTFDQAIRASEILGIDDSYRREWRDKAANMVPPPVTREGWWKQWENQDPVYGWHNFSLALVFPAELVSRWHGPVEWQEQAQRTWQQLKSTSRKTGTGAAWCGGQGLCELIRIGAAEDALAGARWREEEPENGFVVQYDGALIQVDHGPGMCRVLADMCVLGLDGVVHLFPGIPKNVPARCFSLRVPGGFLISAEKRGQMVDYVVIKATADGIFRMKDPWSGQLIEREMPSGNVQTFTLPGLDAATLSILNFAINAG
jgi:alpha-L-fucosidase 2